MENLIKAGVLSYGMSGRVFHCPLLEAHPGFLIHGIVKRGANAPIDRYPTAKVYKSVDDCIKDPEIELIIVNLPNEFHYHFTAKALLGGKHVVVEKPFTVTSSEANELITLARKSKKILTVFQNRRWDGDFLTVKKVLEEKQLGKVVEFEAHYDRWRNYIQDNTWKEEEGPGSGILYNLGSHMIDQVLSLFGDPDFVDARYGIQRTKGKVDDYYDIRMEYRNLNVILKSSYLVRESGPRYVIHGDLGSFVKYGLDPQEQDLNEGKIPGGDGWGREEEKYYGKLNTDINGGHYEGPVETIPGNYLAYYESVYQSIRNDAPLAVTPEESMMGIKIIEACMESNKFKKAVRIVK